MKRFPVIVVLIFCVCLPRTSFAWGATGHRIIAEIAFNYLDEQTKRNVLAYLDGMSIEQAANWMDEMRSDPAYDYMKPYHYVDFDRGQSATALSGDNILGVLNTVLADLQNVKQLSNAEVKKDLLYLFHLVGDLHQPLHVGYPDDKGGNLYQVSFFGDGSNLHKVWDTQIIEYKKITLADVLSSNKLSATEMVAVQNINLVSWANGARSYLYRVYSLNGHKISEQYIDTVYPIIEKQLFLAGLRLAAILQKYFGHLPLPVKSATVLTSSSISPGQAAQHIGETLSVCGQVFGGRYLDNANGQPTLINMGAEYPDNPFTLVIFGSDRGRFPYKPEEYLKGKSICVTGLIKDYKGKPEIVVSDAGQIRLQ